ncbi:hypothetical protein [Clostridium sp. YIM B02569]|uniref:hypothetical protein n=1 Tax=Clostridium sp. YIM B02569 TaxID=2911967 RepID=UPI0005A35A40|nr:hypothetical protein [Clostridium sp. YIM B02569]
MDNYTVYLLDQIQLYRSDTEANPEEKDINEAVAAELMRALVQYQNHVLVGGKKCE